MDIEVHAEGQVVICGDRDLLVLTREDRISEEHARSIQRAYQDAVAGGERVVIVDGFRATVLTDVRRAAS